jgi:hypothetical protein
MIRRLAVVAGLVLFAGCGKNQVHQNADAFVERPAIDPAPYYTDCVMSNPAACPDPYECTVPDLAHDPTSDVCLVPCATDRDCPVDNFCNGFDRFEEIGASNHCAHVP